MPSLRSRNRGQPKQMSVAGNRDRLDEAYWLACAIGQDDSRWDLQRRLYDDGGQDVRGGCPKWLVHPGSMWPWGTLAHQPRPVGCSWQRIDGRWQVAPIENVDIPMGSADIPTAAHQAALPTHVQQQQPQAADAGAGPPQLQQPLAPELLRVLGDMWDEDARRAAEFEEDEEEEEEAEEDDSDTDEAWLRHQIIADEISSSFQAVNGSGGFALLRADAA